MAYKISSKSNYLWRSYDVILIFFSDGGRSHIGFDLHNIRPPPKCSWWSEVGQDILNIFCKCGTTVAVNAEFHCHINWCSALQQILYCACSHDNFQSFRYNDISKEYSMSHKYLFHMYNNNTSYAHLEIFMQFVAITICTVAQNCCKGDEPCQWNTPIFRPSGIENPWTDRHQIWQGWLRRGPHPTCKLWYFYPQGGRLYIYVKLSSAVSIFYTPVTFLFLACLLYTSPSPRD